MWALLLIMMLVELLIEVGRLVVEVWPFLLAVVLIAGLWRFGVAPWLDERARERRDWMRHTRAREEIDRVALQTRLAMYEAARSGGDVIEGSCTTVVPYVENRHS